MRTIIKSILSLACILGLSSCSDYLDKDPKVETTLSYEQIFTDAHYAPGFLNNAYNTLEEGYSRVNPGSSLAPATDEAVFSQSGTWIHLFNNGGVNPSFNPDDIWAARYSGIRICNIFLKELDGLIAESNSIPVADRDRFKGEALFLRAFFHFELMIRYQRVPWVNKVIDAYDDKEVYSFKQFEFQDMADTLSAQCDSAAVYLAAGPYPVGALQGRATAAAAMALKSRLWLYAASPLNNTYAKGSDEYIALWQKAADAAKYFIDTYKGHGLLTGAGAYAKVFSTPYNKEVIFGTSFQSRNDIEAYYLPVSFQGQGLMNPTEDLVECYPMLQSVNTDPLTGSPAANKYDPNNPYAAKRDDRFNATFFYNGVLLKGDTVKTYVGGKDGLNATQTATKTGYYLRKFVNVTLDMNKGEYARRQWIFFRYAEILLNYAEALNELKETPDATVWNNFKDLRTRALLKPFVGKDMTQEDMRNYIKNERRIEFAFEDHRFFDLRRWKDAEIVLNKPVRGIQITRTGNDYSYERFEAEQRSFDKKFYWYPIPRTELLKYKSAGHPLKQNEGWE